MGDGGRHAIRYGAPNLELIARWMQLPPGQDGAFWALNLMRYRAVADYADGRATTLSGREADDLYAPLGPLEGVGAMPALLCDVTEQRVGTPTWDRVGIVRYPSRAAFFAMQQREDFRELHAHKDAGMEFTIVLACLPAPAATEAADDDGALVLTIERADGPSQRPGHAGIVPVLAFEVEGVIVGDERTWTSARFDRVRDDEARKLLKGIAERSGDAIQLELSATLDNLSASISDAVEAE